MKNYQKKVKIRLNEIISRSLIVVIFLLFYSLTFKLPLVDYWDEHVWISQSFYLELFVRGDFKNKLWNSLYSYDEPKLVPYIYSLLFYPKYLAEKKVKGASYDYLKFLIDHNFYWDYNFYLTEGKQYQDYLIKKKKDFIFWKSIKSYKPEDLLKIHGGGFKKTLEFIYEARLVSAVFLVLTCLFVFLISKKVLTDLYSYLIVFLFGINSVIFYTGLRATSEAIFIFLLTLGTYFIILLFSQVKKNRFTLIFFAVTAGLAIQTKLNGIILLIIFNMFFTMYLIRYFKNQQSTQFKSYFLQMVLVNCLSFIIFVSLHPFLYSHPFKNSLFLYQFRYRGSLNYHREFPNESLLNIPGRFNRIYEHFYKNVETNYGLPFIFFQRNYFYYGNRNIFRLVRLVIMTRLVLLSLGSIVLLYKSFRNWVLFFTSKRHLTPYNILSTTFLILFVLILFYLLMDWMPYYIVLIYPLIFIEIFGLSYIMSFAFRLNRFNLRLVYASIFQKKQQRKRI